ncbi:alpha/beta hydrolase [Streptomyces sp. H10-C2]|uniref:alpha/beta hydrolase n=1 Tax=unclassified Streptomyces TaxID=2593676 RepID=UPI0024B8F90B|nr:MULTISPECIES: alpha/beta hydrolase [unclassified Streptomyces]MDJ0343885.1 alpha/beta hydrolase [Streptomyces sp. PH10-H1]MDJ0373474.1 alpha/beta hydrolase [Streptomyces sp. H10-C2]
MSNVRVRRDALVGVAVAIALGAAGCSGGDSKAADGKPSSPAAGTGATGTPSAGLPVALPGSLTGQKLRWERCAAPTVAQGAGEKAPGSDWECSTLKAPLDYTKPDGPTLGLAMIRAKAKGGGPRIGSLVFNFGGPGGSGVATLPSFAKEYDKLRSRYDLVSFDPRGVGESQGVKCLDDKATDASHTLDATPDTPAEVQAQQADTRRFIAACVKNSSAVLAHVDTISAARDMDLMRQVLGDEKLHYFGISYGTELGGVYAHLFPQKVGRAVLDAVVDPTLDPEQAGLGQAKGFQLALDNYMTDCAKNSPACPAGGSSADGDKWLAAFLAKLDSQPLPTTDGREVTQTVATNGIAATLYSKESWKYLTMALTEARTSGTGNLLLAFSDSFAGRDQNGHYNNLMPANTAINCADAKQRYTPEDVKAKLPAFRRASAVFGEFLAWSLPACTGWPVAGNWQTPDVSAPGAAPVLVIGNTGDPATPYEGAQKMAAGLGADVGIGITFKGEGHGAYNSGNTCMTKTVNAYLLDGKVPAKGTTCS